MNCFFLSYQATLNGLHGLFRCPLYTRCEGKLEKPPNFTGFLASKACKQASFTEDKS